MNSLFKTLRKQAISLCFFLASLCLIPALSVQAYSPSQVLSSKEFAYLPVRFDSAEKIQKFLEYNNSILATYKVPIRFHEDEDPSACDSNDLYNNDTYYINRNLSLSTKAQTCAENPDDSDYIISPFFTYGQPQRLIPYYATQPQYGTEIRVADFIWELARGDLNNGCSGNIICIDERVNPINPAFILAIIQKESGLVYGACARPDADTNPACGYSAAGNIHKLAFRLDRATGYYCFENPNKAKSCWDENPEWKYFQGFFRQVYYTTRWFRITTERCNRGGNLVPLSGFYVGNTVTIDGQSIYLSNGITCAMYVYTPHLSANTWNVLNTMKGNVDFAEETGRDSSYTPSPVKLF